MAKSSVEVGMNHESIFIADFAEDGSLKVKNLEEFTDSGAELDFVQAIAAAGAKK